MAYAHCLCYSYKLSPRRSECRLVLHRIGSSWLQTVMASDCDQAKGKSSRSVAPKLWWDGLLRQVQKKLLKVSILSYIRVSFKSLYLVFKVVRANHGEE